MSSARARKLTPAQTGDLKKPASHKMDELKITSETRLRILDEVLGTDADVDKFMIE